MNPQPAHPRRNKYIYGVGRIFRPHFISGVMELNILLIWTAIIFSCTLILSACTPSSTPTFFVPPTEPPPPLIQITFTAIAVPPTTIPTIIIPTPTPPCTNNLAFNQDISIPDGTTVQANQPIDKQWLVTNSGTCNWDSRYRLKLISGDAMSAPTEQALYPARAGSQAKLRIIFTAPPNSGTYQNAWQAYAPDGTAFGTVISIQVIL
jgi:hypothetical protein